MGKYIFNIKYLKFLTSIHLRVEATFAGHFISHISSWIKTSNVSMN